MSQAIEKTFGSENLTGGVTAVVKIPTLSNSNQIREIAL
jgi:hypothetical protein